MIISQEKLLKIEKKPMRDGYGDALVELGKTNPRVVVLCADLANSTRVRRFKELFPERFFEIGISEQDMMGVAAGLALSGKIPFISTYAVFCPGRNWDQLRISVTQNKANVKLVGAHAGIITGPDGATHQALEDIALTRCLPNLTVLAPCDYWETKKATLKAAEISGPVYIRFSRPATAIVTDEQTDFQIGKLEIFREGKDVAIIVCGHLVYEALLAAEELAKEKISVLVANNHTIKPIDKKTIIEIAKLTGALVTVEDHQIMGGMGSAVAEVLVKNYPVPMEMIGIQDRHGQSGQPDELIKEYSLDSCSIKKAVKKVLSRKLS